MSRHTFCPHTSPSAGPAGRAIACRYPAFSCDALAHQAAVRVPSPSRSANDSSIRGMKQCISTRIRNRIAVLVGAGGRMIDLLADLFHPAPFCLDF